MVPDHQTPLKTSKGCWSDWGVNIQWNTYMAQNVWARSVILHTNAPCEHSPRGESAFSNLESMNGH